MINPVKCALCGSEFEGDVPDRAVLEELAKRLGNVVLADADPICPVCDRLMWSAGWEYA